MITGPVLWTDIIQVLDIGKHINKMKAKVLFNILSVILVICIVVFCIWLDYHTRDMYAAYFDGTLFYIYVAILLIPYVCFWHLQKGNIIDFFERCKRKYNKKR